MASSPPCLVLQREEPNRTSYQNDTVLTRELVSLNEFACNFQIAGLNGFKVSPSQTLRLIVS